MTVDAASLAWDVVACALNFSAPFLCVPLSSQQDSVLLSVTPKPLNWDLRRDLAPKLQQLAAKTTSTIRSLLQTQIDAQKANEADDSSSSDDSDSESSSSEEEEEGKK